MSFFNMPPLTFLKDSAQVPVKKDTVTPANSAPLPVELIGATGVIAVNAANLNIEVQTSAFGANPDSVQVSDGTDTLAVNPDGSINIGAIVTPIAVATEGQSGVGRVTEVTIDNLTWTALPATPLAGRNGICIQNRSGQAIKVNYDNSVVGYVGMEIDHRGERQYDIGPILIYAKSLTSSCVVFVEEIS